MKASMDAKAIQSARPAQVPKKKRKKHKKKKKDTEMDIAYRNQNVIQLQTTPLKYKLGSSFYDDSDSSEDEGLPDYKIGGYHPMHVGEILVDRYVIIQKLGWGHFSTVWLAKDIHYNTYVAMKIQRSAPHYLEAAFDEVEILDQVSSYWMKPKWLKALQQYYKDEPERLKKITGEDCYCVQLLNCFIHNGPHGKHFVMVFEILGVNLLEIIKRYNYKGVPLPLVRIMAKQCLMGLDYLHRVCKIIHTDLKPENINMCLTEQEVNDIAAEGCLTTTKMYYQAENVKNIYNAATLDPKSFRGRKEIKEVEQRPKKEISISRQQKKAEKRKRAKQRKKQKIQMQKQEENLRTEESQPNEQPEEDDVSPVMNRKKKNAQITIKNDSSKPTPLNKPKQREDKKQESNQGDFSLKNMNPTQMREINFLLEKFVEVPRGISLPKLKYNEHLHSSQMEGSSGKKSHKQKVQKPQDTKYEYDVQDYEKHKAQLEEFFYFRKKFEQSQKVLLKKQIQSKDTSQEQQQKLQKLGIPALNLDNLDPRKMQQEIEEEKAKKRGPKLDESLRLKICDLGNGCWTYHHFSTEIQTRQYRSPEVIIGSKYSTSADVWSFACTIFEMATGDFLFEPRKGKNFDKDDDHLAQMMELLGRMPKNMAISGKHSRKFFDRSGHLRRIKGLNYWPLKRVLMEKYRFKEKEAQAFADFLKPMLEWDPEKRASAKAMMSHYWLNMKPNYEAKMSEQEYQEYKQKELSLRDVIDEPYLNEEMCKVETSDTEQQEGDFEDNQGFMDDEDPYFSDEALDQREKIKEYRDIAEGKNLNNSFVGPYPENWDHLHIDKGANPQFQVIKSQMAQPFKKQSTASVVKH